MIYETQENEEFCGIDVSFTLSYIKIPQEKKQTARREFFIQKDTSLSDENSDLPGDNSFPFMDKEKLRQIDPFFVTMAYSFMQTLTRIEDKVDKLTSANNQNPSQKKNSLTATCVRISGDGIILISTHEFKRDELAKVNIPLPDYPPSTIILLAKVIKVLKTNSVDSTGKIYTSILKFDSIKEEDRDEIFRYVTNKQRELIRNDKKITP